MAGINQSGEQQKEQGQAFGLKALQQTAPPVGASETKASGVDEQEQKEIIEILQAYFLKETGDPDKAEELLGKLAATITQDDGAKLVHLGKTVFLVLVRGTGMVEVHTMSVDDDSLSLAKSFVALTKYLKNIGVKLAYTYTDDPKYELVAKRTRLPFKKSSTIGGDGKKYTAYYLEFK